MALAMHFNIRKRLSFWEYFQGVEKKIGPFPTQFVRSTLMGEVASQVHYGVRWHVTQQLDTKFFGHSDMKAMAGKIGDRMVMMNVWIRLLKVINMGIRTKIHHRCFPNPPAQIIGFIRRALGA